MGKVTEPQEDRRVGSCPRALWESDEWGEGREGRRGNGGKGAGGTSFLWKVPLSTCEFLPLEFTLHHWGWYGLNQKRPVRPCL